ncbi:hypothetical protein A1QO_03915 [Vibrio genomosp. F10 str. ZF-129]|uniref:Lipoprotein n=1 Tax=Vibrio genomosp. F10 str. ZF-129 TaxID=1187848 RepID=A0A1E5BJM7_9VIBR|nr:hypothetical protein [Vibrio genomosp. F10]OEE37257.1 hypothetical protein A1QO_03915 [Vibrio genomosp. F10 str. ZF-129]
MKTTILTLTGLIAISGCTSQLPDESVDKLTFKPNGLAKNLIEVRLINEYKVNEVSLMKYISQTDQLCVQYIASTVTTELSSDIAHRYEVDTYCENYLFEDGQYKFTQLKGIKAVTADNSVIFEELLF